MPLHLSWQLTSPGSHAPASRRNPAGHWLQLAEAADYAGLDALLMPASPHLPEPLTLAAALTGRTQRLNLVAGVRTALLLPAALATTAQSLQVISGQRLHLNLNLNLRVNDVPSSGSREREFVQLFERLMRHRGHGDLHHQGEHFRLEHAERLLRDVPPAPLWLDGSGDEWLIARYAKHCLIVGRPPRALAEEVQRIRALGRQQQRRIACHGSFALIAHAREEDAWDEAARRLPPSTPASHRPRRLHPHPARAHEIHPNLWQPTPDALPVLVGSYEQVAARIAELQDAGLDGLVLSAGPAVEQCLRLGEHILPLLRRRETDHGLGGARE